MTPKRQEMIPQAMTRPPTIPPSAGSTFPPTPVRPRSQAEIFKPDSSPLKGFMRVARRLELTMPREEARPVLTMVPEQNEVPTFIDGYLREKMKQESAKKIQKCWRSFNDRMKRTESRRKEAMKRRIILIRVFLVWRATASNNVRVIEKCHDRSRALFTKRPCLYMKKKMASLYVFYVTQKMFIPNSIDERTFYYAARLLRHTNARWVFNLWRRTAKSQREFRAKARRFDFTVRKANSFYPVYKMFLLWHKYSEWKRHEMKPVEDEEDPQLYWKAKEKALNFHKARKERAARASLRRICKKAKDALYQNYVVRIQHRREMDASLELYLRNLQARAERAWTSYIDVSKSRREQKLAIFEEWYRVAFDMSRRKFYMDKIDDYQRTVQTGHFFNAWANYARLQKYKIMKAAARIQQKPLVPLMIVFALSGRRDSFFSIRCWQEWVALVRRREAWKKFQVRYSNFSEDLEFKQKWFYQLYLASSMNLVRRFTHPTNRLLPHHLVFSFEGMMRSIKTDRANLESQHWQFMTEAPVPDKANKEDLLIRALVLAIHPLKPYSSAPINVPKNEEHVLLDASSARSFTELNDQYLRNCQEMKKHMLVKMQRDAATFSIVTSHFSAMNFHDFLPLFSISPDENMEICGVNLRERYFAKLEFYPEFQDSCDFHVENYSKESRKLPQKFRRAFMMEIDKFYRRFQRPMTTKDASQTRFNIATLELLEPKKTENTPLSRTVTIESFSISASPSADIPFEEPKLQILKSIKNDRPGFMTRAMSRGSGSSRFSLENMKQHMERIETLEAMLGCCQRFFFAMSEFSIDISNPVIFENNFRFADDANATLKRKARRNLNAFQAEIVGIDISVAIPLVVQAPPFVKALVSAALTCFRELQNTKLKFYCDDLPFADRFPLGSPEAMTLRSEVVSKAYQKFPKLTSKVLALAVGGESGPRIEPDDVRVGCFLLPFIIKPELVREYLRDEVPVDQSLSRIES